MIRAGAAESRAVTDALLGGLAAGQWRPEAWARFIVATLGRSGRTALDHPRAVAELTALHGALAAVGRGRGWRWVTVSWILAVTHLGLLGPRRSIGLASAVTILRANLPAVAVLDRPALGVAALCSDKVDGILARRAGPTAFGHYADSLADAAFWAWFALRHEPDRRLVAAAAAAWVAPVAMVTAGSFAQGRMIDPPRPVWLRPAAGMQALIAFRALQRGRLRSRPGRLRP
ncbi:MAG: CDP-alcohol phosphatidyltransferase family protein [Actinomycetota bacterium]|nr:CDP-alcohol phosphatidyltransferase family protein [Actinomycetota bacterium]